MPDPPPTPTPAWDRTESTTGTPRWVKVFSMIAAVLVLLVLIMMFAGGGRHGPGRHTPSGDVGGRTPPASVTEDHPPSAGDNGGHAPLEGGR